MKKLPIEEKAKRYDEAIERARAIFYQGSYKPNTAATIAETLQSVFPELKESEDDRIRKWLIAQLKIKSCNDNSRELEDMINKSIAWLEKQGEPTSLQINERAWLYLVSDVLTWINGIGQYLDDPRVQELAKKLRNEYAQKLIEY